MCAAFLQKAAKAIKDVLIGKSQPHTLSAVNAAENVADDETLQRSNSTRASDRAYMTNYSGTGVDMAFEALPEDLQEQVLVAFCRQVLQVICLQACPRNCAAWSLHANLPPRQNNVFHMQCRRVRRAVAGGRATGVSALPHHGRCRRVQPAAWQSADRGAAGRVSGRQAAGPQPGHRLQSCAARGHPDDRHSLHRPDAAEPGTIQVRSWSVSCVESSSTREETHFTC